MKINVTKYKVGVLYIYIYIYIYIWQISKKVLTCSNSPFGDLLVMSHNIGELLHKDHTFEIKCSGIKTDSNPVSWPGLTCWAITCVHVKIVYVDLHNHGKQQAYCIGQTCDWWI